MNVMMKITVSTIWAFQVLLVYLVQRLQVLMVYPLQYGYLCRDVVGIFFVEMFVQNYFVEMSVEMTVEIHSLEL